MVLTCTLWRSENADHDDFVTYRGLLHPAAYLGDANDDVIIKVRLNDLPQPVPERLELQLATPLEHHT